MACDALVVAAIDFGTTFSGYAFSFKHEYEKDPTKVSTKNWVGDGVSQKAPTCILINADGKTVDSFGNVAETKYFDLAAEGKHKENFFFKRFKMSLFNNEELGRNELLEDVSGKKLPAKTVFSLSIKYLKDDLIESSRGRIAGGGLKYEDIAWVLTVPAIWNDAAKQFMREAAIEAGIDENKLTIALEPEAASLYCHQIPVERCVSKTTSLASFGPGKRYLVLDAGGGTVDITVHEVTRRGDLKELHKASGGAWGGTKVDDAFEAFLTELTGEEVMRRFREENTEEYHEVMKDFEVKKRGMDPKRENRMSLKIPTVFRETVKNMHNKSIEDLVQSSTYVDKVEFTGDKMRLHYSLARGFFKPAIDSIVVHVRSVLKDPQSKGVEAIVMVGGFSECLILQEAVRETFSDLQIIIPDEPGLAVLKGAVIFGHKPAAIKQRISKYTYGTDVYCPVTEVIDMLQSESADPQRCTRVFSTLVEAGQILEVGKPQNEKTFMTVSEDQTAIGMDIYATLNKNPKFVDEVGCHRIGRFSVPVSGRGKDREVKVYLIFGGTEIKVECIEVETKHVTRLKVDFLS